MTSHDYNNVYGSYGCTGLYYLPRNLTKELAMDIPSVIGIGMGALVVAYILLFMFNDLE